MKKIFWTFTLTFLLVSLLHQEAQARLISFSLERAAKGSQAVVEAKYLGYRSQKKILSSDGHRKMYCPVAQFKITKVLKGKVKAKKIEVLYNLVGRGGCVRRPMEKQKMVKFKPSMMPEKGTTFLLFLRGQMGKIYRTFFKSEGIQKALPGSLTKESIGHLLKGNTADCTKCGHNKRVTLAFHRSKKHSGIIMGTNWKCYQCRSAWPADRGKKEVKSQSRGPRCPQCSTNANTVPILYGMPGPKDVKRSKEGKIFLAGCVKPQNAPKWHCKKCKHQWK